VCMHSSVIPPIPKANIQVSIVSSVSLTSQLSNRMVRGPSIKPAWHSSDAAGKIGSVFYKDGGDQARCYLEKCFRPALTGT